MPSRYLAVKQENSVGVAATSGWSYIDFVADTWALDNQATAVHTAAYRYAKCLLPGPLKITGGWDQFIAADNVGWLLKWGLGAVNTSAGTSGYHVSLFMPADTLKTFTVVECKDDLFERYYGCKVNSLTFDAALKQPLSLTVAATAMMTSITSGQYASGVTYPTDCPFNMAEGTVEIDDAVVGYVKAANVKVENTLLGDDAYTIVGSAAIARFATQMPEGMRTVTGRMDMRFDDQTELKRFYGSTSQTTPQSTLTPAKVELIFQRGSDSATRGMTIELPAVYYDTYRANVNLRDLIVQNVDFTAAYTNSGSPDIKVLLTTASGVLFADP